MTTLTAFLDLAVCPVSYDAVVFMVQAEMERAKIGAERMHVVIFGEIRKKPQYDEAEAEWRLWNIVVPAAHLFGATVSVTPGRRWHRAFGELITGDHFWPDRWEFQENDRERIGLRHHLIGGVIARAKSGEKVPLLSASAFARSKVRKWFGGRRVVTMTSRGTDYLADRNSDALVWRAAHEVIRDRGFEIEPLRDTGKALEFGQGYGELNLDLRMAMYQEAAFNIQANNGAASLCWFSEKPYVMLGAGVPAEEWDGLFVKQGLPLGESWPWARKHQRISYGKETAETIIEEFDRWARATS